jgi:hypothetical protein
MKFRRAALRRFFSQRIWRRAAGISEGGPDFICFGMQKAGTMWLFDQMNARRDVWMPPIKEIEYFTGNCLKRGNQRVLDSGKGSLPVYGRPEDPEKMASFLADFRTFKRGSSGIEWYRKLFDHKGGLASGDISPNYARLPAKMIARLSRDLPNTRFIMLIREPIERLWSALCMDVRGGRLKPEQIMTWQSLEELVTARGRVLGSHPAALWQRWSEKIPPERLRFWFFDDIAGRPAAVVDEICEFLGLQPGPGELLPGYNRKESKVKLAMPAEIRQHLIRHFAGELEACAAVFGGHAIRWRQEQLDRAGRAT